MLKHDNEEQLNGKDGRSVSPTYFDELTKNVKWYHKVLLNRVWKVVLVMVVFSLIIPPIVYVFLYQNIHKKTFVDDGYSMGICSHSRMHRIQCSVEVESEEKDCARYCCYDVANNFCYHTVPSRYSYISNKTWSETEVLRPRVSFTPYDKQIPSRPTIKLHINEFSKTHLNFIIYDPSKVTYPNSGAKVEDTSFTYKIYYPEIHIEIFSKDENIKKPLLSTARGALITADDFWEWNFLISDDELYGFGDLIVKPKVIYNSYKDSNAYPFVIGQRNGSFHGIYIEQNGPLEVDHTESMVLTVRSIGGEQLGVHFFYGPRPEDVVRQFKEYIGIPPEPPYWALGIHFCRRDSNTLRDIPRALDDFYLFAEEALSAELPYDSDCIGDGIFDLINSQVSPEDLNSITAARDYMKDKSLNFMLSLRPHVLVNASEPIYVAALDANILLLTDNTSTTVYEGKYQNLDVVIPDYSTNNAKTWLRENWRFSDLTNSFVLSDNWPYIDSDAMNINCSLDHIYASTIINSTLCESSVPWDAIHAESRSVHKNRHNDYGRDYVEAVKQADPKISTGFLMSASSVAGTLAATLQQNVDSTWEDMKSYFTAAVWASMQGNYVHSIPVCGTNNVTAESIESLCIQWYLASSFLPIFRVHSDIVQRHPLAFSGFARNVMLNALKKRYKLLPYMYGCLMEDKAMLTPMFYEYWDDPETYSLDEQFMVGRAVMIAPNFRPHTTSVFVYIPRNEKMYDLWGGRQIPRGEQGWSEIPSLETQITTLIRAGYIVPVQETTHPRAVETRRTSSITLIVALNCNATDDSCKATGSMFVTSQIKWRFTANEMAANINPWQNQSPPTWCSGAPPPPMDDATPKSVVDTIRVYGLDATYNNAGDYYEATGLAIDLCDYAQDSTVEHVYIKK